MNIEKLKNYILFGTVDANDAKPGSEHSGDSGKTNPDMKSHDDRFHKGHYDGKGRCKYRESLEKGDDSDTLGKTVEEEFTPAEKAWLKSNGFLGPMDNPFAVKEMRARIEGSDDPYSPYYGPGMRGDAEKISADKITATPQDYAELENIRGKIEAAARLLNGRAGNVAALQASRRWGILDSIPDDPQITSDLKRLSHSSDPSIAQQAGDLDKIVKNMAGSKKSGWNKGVGMVPGPLSGNSGSQSVGPSSNRGNSGGRFSDDDAKAILGRVAKSINYHIDQGDFQVNQNAISNYQAAKSKIAALKDPQLDKFCQEIDASLAAGNQKKVGKVPSPSQAWIQAHQPKMPANGLGILQALIGGGVMPAGFGGNNGGTAAPAVKGKFSGQSWTPFSSPSEWDKNVSAVNANHPAISDPNYFKDAADNMTPQQAISKMEVAGDIVRGGYRDAFDPNDPDEKELWAGWSPSKKLSDDTARCCAVCFDDLRKRFPNMPWKANLELRCGTKARTGGQSTHTQDWRRHTVLFNCDYNNIWSGTGLGKSNYGHPDARFPFDVLRHEMGHALISGMLPNGKRMISKWHDAMTAAYGNPASDLEKFAGKYVSSYAVTNKGHGFSMAECLSECFSLATSPDYKPGYLPPPVEDFIFGEMLGMKK